MWIEDPIAHFGPGEVEPTTLDPLEAVQHPVVLASNPKHFYALESLVHMLESGKGRNPFTRVPFTLDDVRPLITPRTLAHEYAEVVHLLVAFGWSTVHLAADVLHMNAPWSSINRFQGVWGFVDLVMVEHYSRLPLVNVNEMHARWMRYASFDTRVAPTRAAELLLSARRSDYANNDAADLHRLADRFVGLMQLFCGEHTNVVVRRRQLIHGFAFLAWRRGLPVRYETAYRYLDLRIESDRADMQNFVLRPSTAQEAVRLAMAEFTPVERTAFTKPTTKREAVSLRLERAVERALAPAHRRYSSAELVNALVDEETPPSKKRIRTTTPPPLLLLQLRPLSASVPQNLYVMLVRHVEHHRGSHRHVSIANALRALVDSPVTLFSRS